MLFYYTSEHTPQSVQGRALHRACNDSMMRIMHHTKKSNNEFMQGVESPGIANDSKHEESVLSITDADDFHAESLRLLQD